jgi:hypothetical protein
LRKNVSIISAKNQSRRLFIHGKTWKGRGKSLFDDWRTRKSVKRWTIEIEEKNVPSHQNLDARHFYVPVKSVIRDPHKDTTLYGGGMVGTVPPKSLFFPVWARSL